MAEQEDRVSHRRSTEGATGETGEEAKADLFEKNTHSFVMRIWREEKMSANRPSVWRGHITHVPSGQRHYFQQLGDVVSFIATYLQAVDKAVDRAIGKRLSFSNRLHQWLCRRLHCTDENQS